MITLIRVTDEYETYKKILNKEPPSFFISGEVGNERATFDLFSFWWDSPLTVYAFMTRHTQNEEVFAFDLCVGNEDIKNKFKNNKNCNVTAINMVFVDFLLLLHFNLTRIDGYVNSYLHYKR